MTELIAALVKQKKTLEEQAQVVMNELVRDKEKDFEERWGAFLNLANADLLPQESYGDGYVDELDANYTMYDNFYCERYQTMYYSDMWDTVQDKVHRGNVTQASADAWREAVMLDGHGSFRYDW